MSDRTIRMDLTPDEHITVRLALARMRQDFEAQVTESGHSIASVRRLDHVNDVLDTVDRARFAAL